jgi:hypothetical protein
MASISCFTCYARADYNLPLFAFAYLLWDVDVNFKNYMALDHLKSQAHLPFHLLVRSGLSLALHLGLINPFFSEP